MSKWTRLWLAWLGMFLFIEIPAAVNKQSGDTLSEHVWRWFNIKDKSKGYKIRRSILGLFLLGLGFHFQFGTTVIPVIVFGAGMGVIILGKELRVLQRILTAIGFGFTAVSPQLFCATCAMPKSLEEAWPHIGTFLVAAYGAFKTNTTIIAPNRKPYTEEMRRKVLGLPPLEPSK